MPKPKHDENTTLLVVGLPDGSIKKAYPRHIIASELQKLKITVSLGGTQAGHSKEACKYFAEKVDEMLKHLESFIDPTTLTQ